MVGEKYFAGWFDDKTSGRAIEEAVDYALKNDCRDVGGEVLSAVQPSPASTTECAAAEEKEAPQTIDVPIFGRIEVKNFHCRC